MTEPVQPSQFAGLPGEESGLPAQAEVDKAPDPVTAVRWWREHWRNLAWIGQAERDDDEPWALPLVVRVEKASLPTHEDALAASALAVVRLLADPDSAPGGPWHAGLERWMDGRIRKVVRRARGIRWTEVERLPGLTARSGGAEVRALAPHPVARPPVEVSKLQVEGLDLAHAEGAEAERRGAAERPGGVEQWGDAEHAAEAEQSGDAEPAGRPVLSIMLAPGVRMSTGKACAQVGHAAHLALLELDDETVAAWASADFPLRITTATPDRWGRIVDGEVAAATVRDAGYTEVEPGTCTCAATFDPPGLAP
ncbi:peptidyl-tRNA hydrolase [Actinopolymorpha singaporensis]|uniref:peptidyl-tRNA hydrolase n=1 Tax=Actinopolymorpha singaporensis TaxID=117157 RepID=A0A1H1NJ78_9ACTN|nr:peptidyl-tRNA hydrolase [Actinopolymorpha singaporensis]SDR98379.1 Peptidyl-tRNA hydrolase PTH2 [Actinopolymorpha singaporensis]